MPVFKYKGQSFPLPDNYTQADIDAAVAQAEGGAAPAAAPAAAPTQVSTGEPAAPVEAPSGDINVTIGGGQGEDISRMTPMQRLSYYQKRAETEVPKVNPVEGNSFYQNAGIAFDKTLSDTGRNLQQLLYGALPGEAAQKRYDQLQTEEEEARRLDQPLMDTVGGKVGYVAGQAAQTALPLGAVTKAGQAAKLGLAARAGLGAASGATAAGLTTPIAHGESREWPMAIAALTGGLLNTPGAGKAALQTVGAKLPPLRYAVNAAGDFLSGNMTRNAIKKIQDEAGRQIGKLTAPYSVPTIPLVRALRRVSTNLPREIQDRIDVLYKQARGASPKVPAGTPRRVTNLTGTDVQELRTDILNARRDLANRSYHGKLQPGESHQIGALDRAQRALDDIVQGNSPPKVGKALQRAYTQFRTGERPFSLAESMRQGRVPATVQGIRHWMMMPGPGESYDENSP